MSYEYCSDVPLGCGTPVSVASQVKHSRGYANSLDSEESRAAVDLYRCAGLSASGNGSLGWYELSAPTVGGSLPEGLDEFRSSYALVSRVRTQGILHTKRSEVAIPQ